MSGNPAQTAKDSKRGSENNIEQMPDPIDKHYPTEPEQETDESTDAAC